MTQMLLVICHKRRVKPFCFRNFSHRSTFRCIVERQKLSQWQQKDLPYIKMIMRHSESDREYSSKVIGSKQNLLFGEITNDQLMNKLQL